MSFFEYDLPGYKQSGNEKERYKLLYDFLERWQLVFQINYFRKCKRQLRFNIMVKMLLLDKHEIFYIIRSGGPAQFH